jgi:hypothetical protein
MTIDHSGALNSAAELTGPFSNNAALIAKLSTSKTVEQCYLQRFADFAAAATNPDEESSFLSFRNAQPAGVQKSLPQLIVAFVQSDMFLERSVQ